MPRLLLIASIARLEPSDTTRFCQAGAEQVTNLARLLLIPTWKHILFANHCPTLPASEDRITQDQSGGCLGVLALLAPMPSAWALFVYAKLTAIDWKTVSQIDLHADCERQLLRSPSFREVSPLPAERLCDLAKG